MRTPSNLRYFLHRPTHQFDFSNTIDDSIEVEEVEDPSESSEQESTIGEKASSEEDSKDISNAPSSETKMEEDSLDERATTIREGL